MVDRLSLTGENIGLVGFQPVLQNAAEQSSESEEAGSDVCSEFQVTIRLLGKKDSVTKLKVSSDCPSIATLKCNALNNVH